MKQPDNTPTIPRTIDRLKLINHYATRADKHGCDLDTELPIRRSHESPVMKMLYDDYFEAPGKEKAHKLLHTTYVERGTH